MSENAAQAEFETIIIGSGFGGLCMAYRLKQAGRDNFVILEKADELGGTWRENTYPGAECDVPSILYSFSFAPYAEWDYAWSKQKQILEYMKVFSRDHGIDPHLRYGEEMVGAHYDEDKGIWHVKTKGGAFTCRFLVSAIGQLHHPFTPDITGLDQFGGDHFHAAGWDHDVPLEGRDIGVVGSAASAVQLIPELAKIASRLTVYQRSPNWVMNKGDQKFSKLSKWLARKLPVIRRLQRFNIWLWSENILYTAIAGSKIAVWLLYRRHIKSLHDNIKDPAMRKILTPDYPIGAKRVLFNDHYYPALARDNVDLVHVGIDRATATGLRDAKGQERGHDVIVMATGFITNPFLMGLDVKGRDGKALKDHWAGGAFAFNGVTTSGFPNLFFVYGPNTNTGHSSVILKIEHQTKLIEMLIDRTADGTVEVKPEAETRFNEEMQERLAKLAWAKVEASWYKVDGRSTNNWPGRESEFRRRLRKPDWNDYSITPPAC